MLTVSQRKFPSTTVMPGYFRFVTLMAFHSFLQMKVDATILEVGVGGTYDSTNIVPKPVVAGITALGIDHVAVLGKTLRDIAWQKSGIYKARLSHIVYFLALTVLRLQEGVPALTVDQPPEGMEALQQRAQELKVCIILYNTLMLNICSGVQLHRRAALARFVQGQAR